MTDRNLTELLELGLRPAARHVEARRLQQFAHDLIAAGIHPERPDPLDVVESLAARTTAQADALSALRQSYVDFASGHQCARSADERDELILEFAERLGSRGPALREDRRALQRWFGYDAVVERFSRKEQDTEQRICFLLDRIGSIASSVIHDSPPESASALFRRLNIEALVTPLLAEAGDERVKIEEFRCFARCLTALPADQRQDSVAAHLIHYVNRAALDPGQNIWIQSEALALLRRMSPGIFVRALRRRLSEHREGDDLFVRRSGVRMFGESLREHPELEDCIDRIFADPSAYVRQGLPESLARGFPERAAGFVRRMALEDPSKSVRAAALLAVPILIEAGEHPHDCLALLRSVLEDEHDVFVLRVALRVAAETQMTLLAAGDSEAAAKWFADLRPALETLHGEAPSLVVRRAAARVRERLWSRADARRRAALEVIENARDATVPGSHTSLPLRALGPVDGETIGRLLAVAAEYDFGLFAERRRGGLRITRGYRFGFRLWRLLHEVRNPVAAKRQAHRHTIGRVLRGDFHAPSAIMNELAETKVPGEPLHIEEEDGWRPYLPLVDEAISSLDEGLTARKLAIYTAEGVTELTPPASLLKRFRARSILTWEFLRFARSRNWRAGRAGEADDYTESLRELGIRIRFRPHGEGDEETSTDPSVTRFIGTDS